MQDMLRTSEYLFAAIFFFEMALKIIALGFVRGDGAYLSDAWNGVDCIVVLGSFVSIALPVRSRRLHTSALCWCLSMVTRMQDASFIRALRAIRPVRIMVRSPQIRVVVSALYRAVPGVLNVFAFCVLFWIILGIMGVNLFAGRFYSCTDQSVLIKADCFGLYNVTADDGTVTQATRYWLTIPNNFDNLPRALAVRMRAEAARMLFADALLTRRAHAMCEQTLLQLGTMSDWTRVMYTAIDSTGTDTGPNSDAHPEVRALVRACVWSPTASTLCAMGLTIWLLRAGGAVLPRRGVALRLFRHPAVRRCCARHIQSAPRRVQRLGILDRRAARVGGDEQGTRMLLAPDRTELKGVQLIKRLDVNVRPQRPSNPIRAFLFDIVSSSDKSAGNDSVSQSVRWRAHALHPT